MNFDRILRDVEGHLAGLDEALRREVMDVLREAVARERRAFDPEFTVERERERRRHAEELRGALEAIHGSVRPDEALDEALKQLARVVPCDFAAVAAAEPGGALRLVTTRGTGVEGLVGTVLRDERLEKALEERRAAQVRDAEQEGPLGLAGAPALRSWIALPLLLEGEGLGLVLAGRTELDTFTEDEVQRAKAVAFWAAAVLRRAQQHDQARRYATLLEEVVNLDQRVFHGESAGALCPAILDGACRVGNYRGGMLVLQTPRGPVVAAASGEGFSATSGRSAPPDLAATVPRRLSAPRMLDVAESLGVELPAGQVYLVPLATPDRWLGCLALLDPNGGAPEDRLLEAYATRASAAYAHAAQRRGR